MTGDSINLFFLICMGDVFVLGVLFFTFIGLALVLTIFGFVSDVPIFAMVGTVMLVSLGVVLLSSGVDVKVGENTTITTNPVTNVTTEVMVDVYDNYDDASGDRYGWLLIALGSLAFILTLFMI